jgi:hypothetical protein
MRGLRSLLHQLWRDEIGVVLSAEAALLGTVGVIGATVGLSAVNKAVNDELTEVASAFRSLDQSYHIEGRHGCGAWTAGSSYRQPCVEESLEELQTFVGELEEHQHHSEHRRHHEEAADHERDDDRPRGRRRMNDDDDREDEDGDGESEDDEDSDDDEDESDEGEEESDDEDEEESDEDDDDDELSIEVDASSSEFSEPFRIRPSAGE